MMLGIGPHSSFCLFLVPCGRLSWLPVSFLGACIIKLSYEQIGDNVTRNQIINNDRWQQRQDVVADVYMFMHHSSLINTTTKWLKSARSWHTWRENNYSVPVFFDSSQCTTHCLNEHWPTRQFCLILTVFSLTFAFTILGIYFCLCVGKYSRR